MPNPTRKEAEDKARSKRKNTRRKKDTVPTPTSISGSKPKGIPIPDINITPPDILGGNNGSSGSNGNGSGGGGISSNGSNSSGSIEVLDVKSLVGGNPYEALDGVPEMDKKQSLELQLQLSKQENALDVRLQRARTLRKAVKVGIEEQHIATDLVNFDTAIVGTQVALENNKQAWLDLDIAKSKTELKQEQLVQQRHATQHVLDMTPLLQEEHSLNLKKQELKNEKLTADLAKTVNDIQLKQAEVGVYLSESS